MKGIVLAGGSGTRLYPLTLGVSKQLLPIYDKPMIYYPLSVLMLAGINDILLISSSIDIDNYRRLLGDGSQFGIKLNFAVQEEPKGIGQAFLIGEKFIGNESVCLVLGDNIFYGQGLSDLLEEAGKKNNGSTIFGYHVSNPSEFGIVGLDKRNKVKSLQEKPKKPLSNYAITGLYFYDNSVINIAKKMKPSKRGEYEITDINKFYMLKGNLNLKILGRGIAWLDTGTHESLIQASNFVQTIESRQGLKIACLEEIAFNKGWISKKSLINSAKNYGNSEYGKHLRLISKGKR